MARAPQDDEPRDREAAAASAPASRSPGRQQPRREPGTRRWVVDVLLIALTLAPILLVYLLPADTSLEQVEKIGSITACVPDNFAPLATPNATDPGFDITLLREIAKRMGVTLNLNVNPLIGRDFRPSNWGINRAGCLIVAGGIAITPQTRSFLETLPTGVETGWTVIQKGDAPLAKGLKVGVYPGFGGLDRVSLSSVLRSHGLSVALAPTADALAEGLKSGAFDIGVTESLSARRILDGLPGWQVAWLPETNSRASLGFGLWKGDLTLKQRIAGILSGLENEGFVRDLEKRYGIAPVERTANFAP